MAIANNTRIRLGVAKPKKDAIVAAAGTAATASEVAIRAGSSVDEALTQTIIGDYWKLFRFAKSNMRLIEASVAAPVVVWMPIGGSDNDITIGVGITTASVGLEIGQDTATGSKSHFLDRTFKRLIERWLEESK